MIKQDWTAKTYNDLRYFKIDGDNNSTVSKTWLLALLVCKKICDLIFLKQKKK